MISLLSRLIQPIPLLIVALVVGCVALGIYIVVIKTRQNNYTRERFSFVALATITSLTVTVFTCLVTGKMPWGIGEFITGVIAGRPASLPPAPTFGDYGLLVMAYGIAMVAIVRLHGQWQGLKSTTQFEREQRSAPSSLLAEGVGEAVRIARRQPAPEVYRDPNAISALAPLEPVIDSLAWRDQARELVRLSSTSYDIDAEHGWHDRPGYWLGKELDRQQVVSIYPVQSIPTREEVAQFLQYSTRYADEQHLSLAEAIVVIHDEVDLATLDAEPGVRIETEASLLDRLVDFRDYRREIARRVRQLLPDSLLSLADVYVPSRISLPTSRQEISDVEQCLLDWMAEPGQRHLALLGEYGQGKSTAALMFAHHLLEGTVAKPGQPPRRVPIIIELRGSSPRNLEPLQFLGAWAAKYRIDPQALMRLHIAGRLVLIFEGFDEMSLVGDREMRLRHFKTLWQFCYPNARILITGRPNFFLDDDEMKAALGIGAPRIAHPYCEAIRLQSFNHAQLELGLRAYDRVVRTQILAMARKDRGFFELASRPSMLHMVAVLWEREKLQDRIGTLSSALVIQLFIRHSYLRQGLKEADAPGFMALNTTEREYFMSGIAAYMVAKRLPNQIGGSQLHGPNGVIDRLIVAIPDAVSRQGDAIAGEALQPLRFRVQGNEQGVEFVKTDVRTCGLLVDDPAAPGTFRFAHKSFMEYLFASVVDELISSPDGSAARSIMKVTGAQLVQVAYASESVAFLAQLVEGRAISSRLGVAARDDAERSAKRAFARELWTLIAGSRWRAIMMRSQLSSLVLTEAAQKAPRPWSYVLGNLTMALASLATVLLVLSRFDWFGLSLQLLPSETVLVVVMCIFFPQMLLRVTSPLYSGYSGIRLWLFLCRRLGVDDDMIHHLAGTRFIPWTRGVGFRDLPGPLIPRTIYRPRTTTLPIAPNGEPAAPDAARIGGTAGT